MTPKQLAQETLDLVEQGEYQADGLTVKFADQQESAVRGTRLYRPDEIVSLPASPVDQNQTIRVADGTTQVVAQTLAEHDEVALLNFASARNPGGGKWFVDIRRNSNNGSFHRHNARANRCDQVRDRLDYCSVDATALL